MKTLEIRLLNEICAPIGGGRESQTFQGYPHAGDVLIRATVLLECGKKGGLHLMCHVETMEGMSNSHVGHTAPEKTRSSREI